jgi:hypothetical protein
MDRSQRLEQLEAELREALGHRTVWTVSRRRWLDCTAPAQTAVPADTRVRALLLKKRRLLLVR